MIEVCELAKRYGVHRLRRRGDRGGSAGDHLSGRLMRTSCPAAGSTVTGDGAARGRSSTWPRMVLYTAPVVIALYGALWIALHADGGRGSTHTFFQAIALVESVLALLLRRRKPVGALAGILAVYLLFSLDPLLLPAVLFALLTVATARGSRTVAIAATVTALALATGGFLRGEAVSFAGYSLPRLAAVGITVAAGTYLRMRRNHRSVDPVGA